VAYAIVGVALALGIGFTVYRYVTRRTRLRAWAEESGFRFDHRAHPDFHRRFPGDPVPSDRPQPSRIQRLPQSSQGT
jgi:hypothetical protein